jgi:fucose permease
MTLVLATIGIGALYLMYGWLLSCIIAGYLAGRKGYEEKVGIATAMILFFIGPIVWLFWPAKEESKWKREGPLPKRRS